jgi:hypothetical protein
MSCKTFWGDEQLRGACNLGYGLYDRGIALRFSSGAKDIFLPLPNRLWGPPNLLSNGYRRLFERQAGHAHASSAEVKNMRNYISTPPYIFLVWLLLKHLYLVNLPEGGANSDN